MHSRPNGRVHWRQAPVTLFILAMAGLVFAVMATLGDALVPVSYTHLRAHET